MNMLRSTPVRNRVLAALSSEEFASLQPFLMWVRLVPNQVLTEQGDPAEHVYFIESGLISVRDVVSPDSFIQVAMIGREGVVSCEAVLQGDQASTASYVVQQPSSAIRVSVTELRRLLPHCPNLDRTCMDTIKGLLQQIVQTAGSNARNTIAERVIRLLLAMHDRVDGDDLSITHEATSAMLGVRRSGITLVVSGLQDAGLVRVGRGRITILDRLGLERHLARSSRTASPRPNETRVVQSPTVRDRDLATGVFR